MQSEELEGFLREKIFFAPKKSSDFSYTGVSLNGGTPKTPQNDRF